MAKLRPIRVEGALAYVPLTKGHEAVIDAADASFVGQFNWFAALDGPRVYAARSKRIGDRIQKMSLHRELMQPPHGMLVDHIDRDGLNNTRGNLRLATKSQNNSNSVVPRNNTAGFKGVSWHKPGSKWAARIGFQGQVKHLGLFDTPEEAHAAYCQAATRLQGEFARFA